MTETESVPYPNALEKHKTIRQSLLASFDSCPLETKFDLEYRKGWSGHPQARGTIFHRMAAKALEQMAQMEERMIDPGDALAILTECLRQHDVPPRNVVAIPASQIKDLRWVTVKWATENVFDIEHLASVEDRMQVEIEYPNPRGPAVKRKLTGQVDALFIPEPDHAIIVDWKETWALPRESEVSERGFFQQRFYAMLVMHRFPSVNRVTLRETYVRLKDEVTETAPIREATVFASELEMIEREMAAMAERFDRATEHGTWPLVPGETPELWTPSPGSHCSYCPRPTACPIFPDARVQGAIETEEQAKLWAGQSIVAKAAQKQRDQALRVWADQHGSIPVRSAKDSTRVLGYRTAKRTARPKQDEVERLLIEEGPHADVGKLYKTTTTSRFDQHSPTEAEDIPDAPEDIPLLGALEQSLAEQGEDPDKPPF